MSDLIVLKCENCGASLEISKEKETFYCQFCGYKHILRNNAKGNSVDESYAACPLCKRNDKTQKLTSLTKFNEFNSLKNELIKAEKPWPPFVEPDLSIPEPIINNLFYLIAVVAGILLLFLFSGLLLGPTEDIAFIIFILFLLSIAATPFYFSVKKIIANKKNITKKFLQ